MTKYKLTATGDIPEFVHQANTLIDQRGDEPLFKFTLREYDTLNQYYQWRASNPQHELKKPEEPKRYLTRRDMANLLRLSLVTLDKYIANGTIRSKKLGRRILFEPGECDRVMGMMANNTFKR